MFSLYLISFLLSLASAQNDLDFWNVERPPDMADMVVGDMEVG